MKLITGDGNNYRIQVDPGDTLHISFDPRGANAPLGGEGKHAVTIGSVFLPDGNLALSLHPDKDLLYSNGSALILHSGSSASSVEFEFLNDTKVTFRKIDLLELLRKAIDNAPFRKGWTDSTGKIHFDF